MAHLVHMQFEPVIQYPRIQQSMRFVLAQYLAFICRISKCGAVEFDTHRSIKNKKRQSEDRLF
jgi:hypothetical protein